jgi:hypothetical protein
MVPSHRACGFAAGAALFPVYGWDLFREFPLATFGVVGDKVMAGGTPANLATLAGKYEWEPGWFPLIARAASPQALLSFRYIDGINSGLDPPRDDWEFVKTKLWPWGPRPTLPRWLDD